MGVTMRNRRLAPVLAAATLLVSLGCSSGSDGASEDESATTTTSRAEDSGATTPEGDPTDPTNPEDATTLSADQLADELVGPVESGDICEVTDVFTRVTPDLTTPESYLESLRVIADAVSQLLDSVPDEVSGPLGVVLDGTEKIIAVLDANGADLSDPAVADLQNDEDLVAAQLEFEEWLAENCD